MKRIDPDAQGSWTAADWKIAAISLVGFVVFAVLIGIHP